MNFLSPNLPKRFTARVHPSTFAKRSESNRYRAFALSAPNGPLYSFNPLSSFSGCKGTTTDPIQPNFLQDFFIFFFKQGHLKNVQKSLCCSLCFLKTGLLLNRKGLSPKLLSLFKTMFSSKAGAKVQPFFILSSVLATFFKKIFIG